MESFGLSPKSFRLDAIKRQILDLIRLEQESVTRLQPWCAKHVI